MISKSLMCSLVLLAWPPAFAGTLIISSDANIQAAPAAAKVIVLPSGTAVVVPGGAAVVVQPSVPVSPPVIAAKTWSIKPDDLNLANVFVRWGKEAGYRVLWDARKNVLVDGSDRLTGSFEDAITLVLQGPAIAMGPYPLEVCFYSNTPPLARITRKGEQEKECN